MALEPPAAHTAGEHIEGLLRRRFDKNALANRRGRNRQGHLSILAVAVDLVGEGIELPVPELVEPFADLAQSVRIDTIDSARALRRVGDEGGLLQHLQML